MDFRSSGSSDVISSCKPFELRRSKADPRLAKLSSIRTFLNCSFSLASRGPIWTRCRTAMSHAGARTPCLDWPVDDRVIRDVVCGHDEPRVHIQ